MTPASISPDTDRFRKVEQLGFFARIESGLHLFHAYRWVSPEGVRVTGLACRLSPTQSMLSVDDEASARRLTVPGVDVRLDRAQCWGVDGRRAFFTVPSVGVRMIWPAWHERRSLIRRWPVVVTVEAFGSGHPVDDGSWSVGSGHYPGVATRFVLPSRSGSPLRAPARLDHSGFTVDTLGLRLDASDDRFVA